MTTLPFNIELKKINNLFQKLSELLEVGYQRNENLVPEEVQNLMAGFQQGSSCHAKSQNIFVFVAGINSYMHKKIRGASEIETVKAIIKECPEFLFVKDSKGNLPLHIACGDNNSSHIYVPLLARVGVYNGVGGNNGRGGLLVEGSQNLLAIGMLARKGNIDVIKRLRSTTPPLFKDEDITNYNLVHLAVFQMQLKMVKYLISNNLAAVYSKTCKGGCLPLHFSQSLEMVTQLLESAIMANPSHATIGGLFAKDDDGKMPIDHILTQHNSENAWNTIAKVLSKHKDVTILHEAIRHAPSHVDYIIKNFPYACFLRDQKGRLPVHVALHEGMKWSGALISIMNANSDCLWDIDPVTGFYPVVLASCEPSCDLKTIDYLMRVHPGIVFSPEIEVEMKQ